MLFGDVSVSPATILVIYFVGLLLTAFIYGVRDGKSSSGFDEALTGLYIFGLIAWPLTLVVLLIVGVILLGGAVGKRL